MTLKLFVDILCMKVVIVTNTLGERIKRVRIEADLTQAVFSEKVGLKRNSIALVESGDRNTSEPVIRAICREFDISYEWLTDGVEPMYVPRESSDMAALERIMTGSNEYVKSIFRELADMPEEWWEQAVDMLKRVEAAKKGRP